VDWEYQVYIRILLGLGVVKAFPDFIIIFKNFWGAEER
jgi:hypothetical protein